MNAIRHAITLWRQKWDGHMNGGGMMQFCLLSTCVSSCAFYLPLPHPTVDLLCSEDLLQLFHLTQHFYLVFMQLGTVGVTWPDNALKWMICIGFETNPYLYSQLMTHMWVPPVQNSQSVHIESHLYRRLNTRTIYRPLLNTAHSGIWRRLFFGRMLRWSWTARNRMTGVWQWLH